MSQSPMRLVHFVAHPERDEAQKVAQELAAGLTEAGIEIQWWINEQPSPGQELTDPPHQQSELVIVFGGDGSILRGAEIAHRLAVPLLGVNLGRVGFLAEVEPQDVAVLQQAVVQRQYRVERRLCLQTQVFRGGAPEPVFESFALNELTLERHETGRMLDVLVAVDDHPVSQWGCDGVIVATPSGSTAYAFSAGGPIIWPEVAALEIVPISAHALFARPLVVAPSAKVTIDLLSQPPGVLWNDGRREFRLEQHDRVLINRHRNDLKFARLKDIAFGDRLVAKFSLPIGGWRGIQTHAR